MGEKWTPERIAEVRELCSELMRFIDNDEPDPSISPVHREAYILRSYTLRLRDELLIALNNIESQSAELEAARRLAKYARVVATDSEVRDFWPGLLHEVDRYDAVRSQNTTTVKDTKMKNWNDFFSRDELTIRDVDLAMIEVFNRRDTDEAKAFVDAYRKITPSAVENLGYLAGYRDPDTMCAMWEFFNVYHPVFGRRRVSYEEAFELGRRWMQDSTK